VVVAETGPAAPVPDLARAQRLVVLAAATTTRLARQFADRTADRAATVDRCRRPLTRTGR
jgi:hypothetical protein